MSTDTRLRRRLAALVAAASDGEITAAEMLRSHDALAVHGLTSLGYLRLVDAVEEEFGVELDGDAGFPDDLDALERSLLARGVDADAAT